MLRLSAELSFAAPGPAEPFDHRLLPLHPAERISSESAARLYAEALARLAARPEEAVAVDVHLPFCPMLCLHCSCDISITHDAVVIDRYLDALEREVDLVADRLGNAREVLQLHFGGGTPNYLSEAQLVRAMDLVTRRFRLLPETEVSVNCDPRRTSAIQLDHLRALGFRRVTFGMVDLHPQVQRLVGRYQSAAMMRNVCELAVSAGFESICVDMRYGLPEQTGTSLRDTLAEIVSMGPDRVSCREYVHRPAVRAHHTAILGELPGTQARREQFEAVVATLADAGYTWIGIDQFALDTDELSYAQAERRLRCNVIAYTAMPVRHVLGFGSGATGDVDGTRVRNVSARQEWQAQVQRGGFAVDYAHARTPLEKSRCEAAMHLLCNLELPARLARGGLQDSYAGLQRHAATGLLEVEPDRLPITPRGRFALQSLCAELLQLPLGGDMA